MALVLFEFSVSPKIDYLDSRPLDTGKKRSTERVMPRCALLMQIPNGGPFCCPLFSSFFLLHGFIVAGSVPMVPNGKCVNYCRVLPRCSGCLACGRFRSRVSRKTLIFDGTAEACLAFCYVNSLYRPGKRDKLMRPFES